MKLGTAAEILSALSGEIRLNVFRILTEYGYTGTAAGTISGRLGMPHNTLSFHLAHLSRVGLVTSRKQGRSMIYTANFSVVEELINYLKENCCVLDQDGGSGCDPLKGGQR